MAGIDDWVPLAAVDGIAQRAMVDLTELNRRRVCLEAIAELVNGDLVKVGDVSDGGFFEWEGSLEENLRRIQTVWEAEDPNVWGFAVWFSNTSSASEQTTSPI